MNYTKKALIMGTLTAVNLSAISPNVFAQADTSAKKGTVDATYLYVRSIPSANGAILGTLKKGQSVSVLSKENGWAKILFNGKEAFVSLEFLRFNASAPNPQPPTNNNSSVAAETGTINADRLNVRASASAQGAVLGKLNQGQSVSVLSKSNGWAKILFNGKEAFVSLEFLRFNASAPNPQPPTNNNSSVAAETGTINADRLNVRASASAQGAVLGKLNQGQSVSVLSKSNGWAKILFNGKEAFVSLEFLRFNASAPNPQPPTNNNSSVAAETGTINADHLNVRASASAQGTVLGKLNQGQSVSVLSKSNGWAKILFNGKEAFVSLEFLRFNASAPNPQPPTNNNSSVVAETGTINADRLNVRASASAQGAVLGKLNQGQSVSILSKDNGWAKILFNGKEAFVSLAFLQLAKPTSVGNEAPSANHSETGLVNVNLLNIRASASGQANILGKLKQGQSVSVLSKSNGWAKILFNEKEAYVSLEFLRFNTAPTDTPQNSQLKQTVTVPQATVQEGASYSSKSIGTVNKGAEVSVISKDGDWIKILYNNKEGFIPSLAVQTLTQEETTIVTASALNVRSAPSTSGSLVGKLNKGQTVSIISKVNGWAKIIFNGKEAYVSLGYLDTNTSTVSYSVITSSHTILQPHKKEAEAAFAALQEDGYLTRNGKIINMKNGFVRTNKLANIYDSNTNQKLTYVAPNTDLKFVKTVGSLVYVTLDGQNGYVTLEDVTLYPNMLHAATSYYTVKSGNIIYNSYDSSTNSYYTFNEGYAPAHLSAGIQYEAFDRTSIGGQDSYQYFEYLPLRVPASYTAAELDAFIKANRPDSPLIGTGQYFIEAANKQHINVSYLLAHALIESGWGTSRIAKEKHNLFGFQAVDSNPYGGAASFATLQQGIEFCAQYINKNYLTPGSQFYNGAFIGDKARGMNVLYASDSSWARGIASLMHKLDTMYRDRNHQAYQLSKISAGVTLLQNLGGQKAGVTSREIIVAIKGSVQTPQGLYYEVFSDNPQYNSVFINAKDIKLIQAY